MAYVIEKKIYTNIFFLHAPITHKVNSRLPPLPFEIIKIKSKLCVFV